MSSDPLWALLGSFAGTEPSGFQESSAPGTAAPTGSGRLRSSRSSVNEASGFFQRELAGVSRLPEAAAARATGPLVVSVVATVGSGSMFYSENKLVLQVRETVTVWFGLICWFTLLAAVGIVGYLRRRFCVRLSLKITFFLFW